MGKGGKHLYFLASTNLALRSGWANTSQLGADPKYGVYLVLLKSDDETPFAPESDEENPEDDSKKESGKKSDSDEANSEEASSDEDDSDDDSPKDAESDEDKSNDEEDDEDDDEDDEEPAKVEKQKPDDKNSKDDKSDEEKKKAKKPVEVKIDFDGIERRILSIPMPVKNYSLTLAGPDGSVFIGERVEGKPGLTLHKYKFKDRKPSEFIKGAGAFSLSADGKKILYRSGDSWTVSDTTTPPTGGKGKLNVSLRINLDRLAEWNQIFNEAWNYERNFFYDPKHAWSKLAKSQRTICSVDAIRTSSSRFELRSGPGQRRVVCRAQFRRRRRSAQT